jgi:hypothetical protein
VRRCATAVPAVVATVIAVLTLTTGTSLAQGSERSGGATHAKATHAAAHQVKPVKKAPVRKGAHPKVKPLVTLTGVITATPTATIGSASDTATTTITIAVKGGARELHRTTLVLTLDKNTVVRRGDAKATPADLRLGDHVSVRARRMPDGSWLGLRVNASGPRTQRDD